MAAIPFHGIDVTFGTEQLHFQVSVQRIFTKVTADNPATTEVNESTDVILRTDAAVAQTATDAAAITANPNLGVRQLTIGGLLLAADHQSMNMAEYLVDKYSTATSIVTSLTVILDGLSTADRATVAALDIADIVALAWTPTGTGSATTQTSVIEGVTYRSAIHGTTSVVFDLSATDSADVFTLDSATLGVLDTDVLAF